MAERLSRDAKQLLLVYEFAKEEKNCRYIALKKVLKILHATVGVPVVCTV